jgi:signal transduction histidine kinase
MEEPLASDRTSNIFRTVNTSLTVIVGNAQLLERKIAHGDPVTPDDLLSILGLIQRRGREAAEDVRSLQTLERSGNT